VRGQGGHPPHQCRGLRPPAKLYGHVHSTNEANAVNVGRIQPSPTDAARAVATLAPGIANVESYLVVTPCPIPSLQCRKPTPYARTTGTLRSSAMRIVS
jgi:hypothetical protein